MTPGFFEGVSTISSTDMATQGSCELQQQAAMQSESGGGTSTHPHGQRFQPEAVWAAAAAGEGDLCRCGVGHAEHVGGSAAKGCRQLDGRLWQGWGGLQRQLPPELPGLQVHTTQHNTDCTTVPQCSAVACTTMPQCSVTRLAAHVYSAVAPWSDLLRDSSPICSR